MFLVANRFSHLRVFFAHRAALSLLLAVGAVPMLWAQVTTATISGTAKDRTGAVLPGVTVSAKNVGTGLTRTLVSDEMGRYAAVNLAVGRYEVKAELPGFQTVIRSGIELTVERHAVVDLVLEVGEMSEQVVVTGEAALVDAATSAIGGLVNEQRIVEMPLNGRDWAQLTALEGGVLVQRQAATDSAPRGFGLHLSIGGARPNQNTFLLDGTRINDTANATPGSASNSLLGVDTLKEFTVVTNTYSAEYGVAAGGVVNAVTKSGTNEFHGSVFEFHRNSALDARNFFDRRPNPPPFKRNQFGFSASGPVRKNRTFFLGSYEGLREGLGTTSLARVPTAEARRGVLPTGTVEVHPSVKPYLELYPLPNGQPLGGGVAEFVAAPNRVTTEDYVTGRVDHLFSDADNLFGRYTFNDSSRLRPGSLLQTLEGTATRAQYLTLEEKKVFSPSFLNTFRFGFNRTLLFAEGFPTDERIANPALQFIPGVVMGAINITALTGVSSGTSNDEFFVLNQFEWADMMALVRGSHSLKFGVDIKRFQDNRDSPFRPGGQWQFDSLRDFLINNPSTFETMFPGSDANRGLRQSLLGTFVQDDIKVRESLTLNLGLRYEFVTEPKEVNGKLTNLRDPLRDQGTTVGRLFKNPSLKNFAPRLGLAWDPFGSGKTSVRAGFGIFYDQMLSHYYQLPAYRLPPFFLSTAIARPSFPDQFRRIVGGAPAPTFFDVLAFEPDQPYRIQYSLSLQRQILSQTVLDVSYVGSRGVHVSRVVTDANLPRPLQMGGRWFFPAGLSDRDRRNPALGQVRLRTMDGSAFYNSLQMKLNRRFHRGLQLQFSYTFSKSVDDSSALFFTDLTNTRTVLLPEDRKMDRGVSDFHLEHNFSANFTYELPVGPGKALGASSTGLLAKLIEGWQLGGIVSASTGTPITIALGFDRARSLLPRAGSGQRPDLVPGGNNNPVLGDANRYFDRAPFQLPPAGNFGNVGRNTGIGPGLITFDFSLFKNVAILEQKRFQFRAEIFNLLNRPNFALPATTVFDRSGPVATFGRITGTATTSRQIQFGLKFLF